jgi:glycosyltransferase involved in cell wall biosynthesis
MKKKILFVFTTHSTFVKTDYEILSSKHEVIGYQFKPVKGLLKTGFQLLKQFFFLILFIWKFDMVFVWFADQHSFLPVFFAKLLKKKSFVVIGGYDVARIPELNYGVFNSKMRGFFAIQSMKSCSLNLTVSEYVHRKVKWISGGANSKKIFNCLNIEQKINQLTEKENLIITVGLINSTKTFYLKGIDTFFKVAKILSHYKFKVIGINKSLKELAFYEIPENLELIEPVEHSQLSSFYERAKIYCQFSKSESFGVSIVESISFGCLPIVTNVGGMPEIVGDNGIVVKKNPKEIAKIIQNIMIERKPVPNNQQSILRFSYQKRAKMILDVINNKKNSNTSNHSK